MKSGSSFYIRQGLTMTIAVVVGVFVVVGFVQAATTISTNISTAGTLLVNNATSTISNLDMLNSTSTNATSTTFLVTGLAKFTGGLLANNATSTINNLDMVNSTSTSATSTTITLSRKLTNTGTSTLATSTVAYLSVGSTTPSIAKADALIDGIATTTLGLYSSGAVTIGTCIQMRSTTGENVRMYIGTVAGTLIVEAGLCK